jgi:hypothetical protein
MFRTKNNPGRWKGKSFEQNSIIMNELRQRWSIQQMSSLARWTKVTRFDKTALNFL